MAVGWIDTIYVSTNHNMYMSSHDSSNNGVLNGGLGSPIELDNFLKVIAKDSQYHADWCGIPWYHNGIHFKIISKDDSPDSGVKFYQSEINHKNWVVWEEAKTGKEIARQTVPSAFDYHCKLTIADNSILLEIINDQTAGIN